MRKNLFAPTREGEARLLLLIRAFSSGANPGVEGRTKLAKLDFLLRYPAYFERALAIRAPEADRPTAGIEKNNIETPMLRYRYGPWDPAYFALLGSLLGRGLIRVEPGSRGPVYVATASGEEVANRVLSSVAWEDTGRRASLLKRHFDLTGASLKKFIYEEFPEITNASWGTPL